METSENIRTRLQEFEKSTKVSDTVTNGRRLYVTPDGNKYPSVTTVLSAMEDKTWLAEWKARVGEEKANEITKTATTRGTSMHSLIESRFRGEPVDREAKGYSLYKKLRIFIDNIDPFGLEVPLWSDRLKLAGRTDCVGMYRGKLSIIDYKTASREKSAEHILGYFHQSALYAAMLLERLEIPAKQIVILISVNDGFPQEFIRPTSQYLTEAVSIVNRYHQTHG